MYQKLLTLHQKLIDLKPPMMLNFIKTITAMAFRQVQQPKRVNSITLEQISFEYVHIEQI